MRHLLLRPFCPTFNTAAPADALGDQAFACTCANSGIMVLAKVPTTFVVFPLPHILQNRSPD